MPTRQWTDDSSLSLIISSLLECQRLKKLVLPVTTLSSHAASSVVNLIEKNASSLTAVSVPVGDEDLPLISPAIQKCTGLVGLDIGSQSLTTVAAAPLVVDILRQQSRLTNFALIGSLDDDGFSPIAEAIGGLHETLKCLSLSWTELSPAMIRHTLSPLTKLKTARSGWSSYR